MNTPFPNFMLPQNPSQRNSPETRMFAGLVIGSIEWQRRTLQMELETKEHGAAAHQRDADAGGLTPVDAPPISAEICQQCADHARYVACILRAALAALPTAETAQADAEAGAAAAVGSSYETRPWEAWETP